MSIDAPGFSWTNPETPGAPEPGNRPKHSPLLVVIGLGALLIVGWLVLTVVGGKSSGGKLNPIAQAADRTTSASGVRLSINLSGALPELPTGVSMRGAGALDFADGTGRFTVSGVLPAPIGSTRFDYVISDGSMYMSSPIIAPVLPPGKSWVQLPTSGDSSSAAEDPHAILKNLEASSSQIVSVGKEQIRHVVTTHYQATTALNGVEVPVDVWVDGRGLVRRIQETASESGGSLAMSVDLFDYGYKPQVTAPPSDEVADPQQLAQAAGVQLSQ